MKLSNKIGLTLMLSSISQIHYTDGWLLAFFLLVWAVGCFMFLWE